MPRPILRPASPTDAASGAAGGGQGGSSLAVSLAIHGAALATLVLALDVPIGFRGSPEQVVEARIEPRTARALAADPLPVLDEIVAPPLDEPVLEPLEVPEAAAPRASTVDGTSLDEVLLTAARGTGPVRLDPLGRPTLPAPARKTPRPRLVRPRALPADAAAIRDVAPEPAPLGPPIPDTSPLPLPGHCPPPAYPPIAERRGLTGTVLLAIEVAVSGVVTAVRVERSSGHDVLDEAARRAVRSWRFKPASYRGLPTAAIVNKPIEFTLPGGR
ncbi:MAG: TonB family protein [Planctomycetota bacterium]|nr:TonB family protein [Planctomycetota bacterium]MEC8513215.1 TonB family protein [Planctomycetota bacterium]